MYGVYYPTSPLMLHHIMHIYKHMNTHENDNLLRHVVVLKKDKILKYWRTIPFLYAFAFILGSVSWQFDNKDFDNLIYYASLQLLATEKKYTTTKQEALGMIFAVQNSLVTIYFPTHLSST